MSMVKLEKRVRRQRRARRSRGRIAEQRVPRLCAFRSNKHIYVQLISACGTRVLAQAGSVEKEHKGKINGGSVDGARSIGEAIGKRAIEAGVSEVAFDRSGYAYHGRVMALADGARSAGLKF